MKKLLKEYPKTSDTSKTYQVISGGFYQGMSRRITNEIFGGNHQISFHQSFQQYHA